MNGYHAARHTTGTPCLTGVESPARSIPFRRSEQAMWSKQDCAKILVLAVLFLCAGLILFPAPASPATLQAPTIYVANASTNVTDASVGDALPAFQAAIDADFSPAWNQTATLTQLAPGEAAPAGAWTIGLDDYSDVSGAAGYHSTTPADVPYGRVFTRSGLNWQLVFTHELFEMLADPHIDRATFVWPSDPWARPSRFYLLEVGDPVESQRWSYTRPSASGAAVVISDFVTERWFDCQGGAALDFAGHVHHCLHLLDGGYSSVFGAERVHGRPAGVFHVKG